MEIEISCATHGCRSIMSGNDDVYCEGCLHDKDNEIEELKKKIEQLEEEVNRLDEDLASSSAAAVELKDIIKACPTCSAILVAKNL